MESGGRLCPAHRHRPEQPAPQGFAAVAAFERDDRVAVSERVPHRLPGGRGNRMARAVQAGRTGFHTSRTGASAFPPRCGTPGTCFRKPSRADALVTAAWRRPVQSHVRETLTVPVDSLPHTRRTVAFTVPLRMPPVVQRAASDLGVRESLTDGELSRYAELTEASAPWGGRLVPARLNWLREAPT